MGIGFPQSYQRTIELVGSRQTARGAVIETFEALELEFDEIDPYLYRSKLPFDGRTWGQTLTISLEPGCAVIQCKGSFPQIVDLGHQRKRVNEFVDRFSIKEVRNAKIAEWKTSFDVPQSTSPIDRLLEESKSLGS